MRGKIHYINKLDPVMDDEDRKRYGLCGKIHVKATENPGIVTCKLCLSRMEKLKEKHKSGHWTDDWTDPYGRPVF